MSLLERAEATASEVCGGRVITVLGHDHGTVFKAMNASSGFVVVNEDYRAGLGTSIAAAVRACRGAADAIIVLLADQPLVTAAHLQDLVASWSGSGNEIVASSYSGTRGPPVLFPRLAITAMTSLSGDEGARSLLNDDRFRVKTVRFEPGAFDIDTREDLDSLV